jgi:hypothetical protein
MNQGYLPRVIQALAWADQLGLTGYWRGIIAGLYGATNLTELEREWHYANQVCDHCNLFWPVVVKFTKKLASGFKDASK